ncbi:MAG: histone deacetylase [Desulfobacterales bacterium]|nr:histone deacetylase [Desulfobacterales bacterium]MBF0397378.1 histone deacetylase [Desulfobacterales bacterium]
MIKRETLKHAIDEISARAPEIGYSLDEMLSSGVIGVSSKNDENEDKDSFLFLFQNQEVSVKKFLHIHEGTVPIEQQLLIKYGEFAKKQEIENRKKPLNYREAAKEIHEAGLRLMVFYEIDYAMDRVKKELKGDKILSFLEALKNDNRPIKEFTSSLSIIFEGELKHLKSSIFIIFPLCLDALIQVAALNLEFFHVRFILSCFIKGTANQLFACVGSGKILGLIYLQLKNQLLRQSLEIKYLATVAGLSQIPSELQIKKIKGIGTFLVSGTWLLWKSKLPNVKEIVLDSETGAKDFYKSIGFNNRKSFEYYLKKPSGYLLPQLITMTNKFKSPPPDLIKSVCKVIHDQFIWIYKNHRKKSLETELNITLNFLKLSLHPQAHSAIVESVIKLILKYKNEFSQAKELFDIAVESGWIRLPPESKPLPLPLLVIQSKALFYSHLENIFHLENFKRVQAVQAVLNHSLFQGKLIGVVPRLASYEELALVHTARHIEQIAQTLEQPLFSLDIDTQTTEESYDVARLAVGSLFNLLDAVWANKAKRGFACIRPPGHHAEPDKAMGFCIFNNVALGARYMQKRYDVDKVMIIDIDAHHGNGIQNVFYDTDKVLYSSFHLFPGFPGTGNLGEVGSGKGEGFTVNIPLKKGQGDRSFIEIIHFLIGPIAREYKPEIILVACGFDLYQHDRLGGMRATPLGYAMITALLIEIAEKVCQGRIVFILEGGYSIKGIKECGFYMLKELCGVSGIDKNKLKQILTNSTPKIGALKKAMAIHKKYWQLSTINEQLL